MTVLKEEDALITAIFDGYKLKGDMYLNSHSMRMVMSHRYCR